MSVFDIFTSTPTPVAPVKEPAKQPDTPAQPGNLQATSPNTVTPKDVAKQDTPDSPLDPFKNLWDTVDKDKTDNTPIPLDATKLEEVIGKASFTGAVSKEQFASIAAGGEEAQKAFADSMNAVAKQVMLQSTLAANKMIEQRVTDAITTQAKSIPELIRQQATTNSLAEVNPLFTNPAVKPVLDAVQTQLAAKNPNATPKELTAMAQDFISVLGESFAPKPATKQTSAGRVPEQDWSNFFS